MKILTYKPDMEKHGFILFSANFGDRWDLIKDEEHVFIYSSDFEYIIESIREIYPFKDPETKERQEFFDTCGMNCIPVGEWDKILDKLQGKVYENLDLKDFIDSFCTWIQDRKANSDEIMIWGTL